MKAKFISVMLMTIVMASCTQEDRQIAEFGTKSLCATIEENGQFSRVGFSDGNAEFFWTKGDVIGVTTDQSSSTFVGMTFQGTGGESSGNFTGNISGNPAGYAVYPDHDSHSMNGVTLSYYLEDSYNYTTLDATYADPIGNGHNAPMWGSISNGSVSFKHLGGVAAIEVNGLSANTSNMKFVFTADSKINGTFTANLQDNIPQLVTTESNLTDADKTVIITFKTGNNQTKGYFYVPLPVCPEGDKYNFRVKVTDSNGNEIGEGAWDNIYVQRTNIFRRVITAAAISGGVGETKTVANVSDITNSLDTEEDDLVVKVSEEVPTGENSIIIPETLSTNTTTLSFASVADGAKITIDEATSGSYTGKIVIEIPEGETLPEVVASVPNGEVYIKQGTVTTLVVASASETTIIGATAVIGTLTVEKGNVRIEDGGQVGTINRSNNNNETVNVIYESATVPTITLGQGVVLVSAAEWDLRKAIAEGGSYTLTSDVEIDELLKVEKDLVLDLNGYTLAFTPQDGYPGIKNTAKLEVKDSKATGKITSSQVGVQNNGTLVINCDVETVGNAINNVYDGETTINGGTYKNTSTEKALVVSNNYGNGTPVLTINGGSFESVFTNVSYNNGSTGTVNAGSFKCTGGWHNIYVGGENGGCNVTYSDTNCTFESNGINIQVNDWGKGNMNTVNNEDYTATTTLME